MEERKFVIKIMMNDDLSEYVLVCLLNDKVVRKKVEYSMGDSIYSLYDFQRSCYDDFEVDCRFDSFEIKIDIYC